MRTIRFRLSGPAGQVGTAMNVLSGIEGVDRVEEVAGEMPHEREDSSSAGMSDDETGDFHDIELHATNAAAAEAARDRVEILARDLGIVVEWVDRF